MNKTCMAELVSMIIPVYNTPEQFLDECLDSVRKQSYKELEVPRYNRRERFRCAS